MMTAFDSYWAAIVDQNLPATVPVASETSQGIATATFDVADNGPARAGAVSCSWRDRALMAIYACRAAREGIDTQSELHTL